MSRRGLARLPFVKPPYPGVAGPETQMTRIARTTLILLATAALTACGASDVASPGEFQQLPTTPPPSGGGGGTTPPGTAYTGAMPPALVSAGFIDRGTTDFTNKRVFELPTRLTDDVTIPNIPGVVYKIAGPVNVGSDVGGAGTLAGGDPVTLTIQAGTVLYGEAGSNYMVVNRGSRLVAVGTATQPIIFTSKENVAGTATDSSQGLWGGVILLGRAQISNCDVSGSTGTAACENVIEGTTGSKYGGATNTDNSGTLQYVQIRYSGTSISTGNELQGLTLGGVGSGTTISHVQVHNSSDDGIEIFGGRANLKNLVITGADDDSLDTDVGYQGYIQFVIAVQRDANNGDSMVEADSNGNEDDLPRQHTRLANFTFVQRGSAQGDNAILLRGGTDYTMVNGVVVGPDNCLDIDETAGTTTRAADSALQDAGPPRFNSVVFSCPTAFRNDGNVATTTIQTIFTSAPSTGNNSAFTSTLSSVFINGANETAVTPFNASTLNSFFVNTDYIGAVKDATDANAWYAGWTCNASYVNFGATSANCTTLPSS